MSRTLVALIATVAIAWHGLSIMAPPKVGGPPKDTLGRDFASYYYAARAAWSGENPYDKAELETLARREKTRTTVHPYFYPPPYLFTVSWAVPFSLEAGYALWYWFNELCLIFTALVLWRWWRPLGPAIPVALFVVIAVLNGIPYGHTMGQVNFLVLALVVLGMWRKDEGQPVLAGALVGLACMLKMSPAVFVAWWLLQREWVAVASACICAVVLTILSLPLVGPADQWHFYTQVLPQFGSGNYNGLVIKIDMFGNHSLPNLINQVFPGHENQLSAAGRMLSTGSTLILLAVLGWLFRKPATVPWNRAAQISAVAILGLLIPVYTYEHHLVWTIPAMVLAITALASGRLDTRWAIPVALAVVALGFHLPPLKQLWVTLLQPDYAFIGWFVQEMKFAGLIVLLAAMAYLGTRPPPVPKLEPRTAGLDTHEPVPAA